ncbi:hypothetical protein TSAR_012985, partial [Trichomalopsis sarcophagae]
MIVIFYEFGICIGKPANLTNTCRTAQDFLNITWTYKILYFGQRYQLTILRVQYTGQSLACRNLFFDKTSNLNGYNVKVAYALYENAYRFQPAKAGYNRFDGSDFKLITTVLNHINATVTAKEYSTWHYLDEYGRLDGIGRDLSFGYIDLSMIIH